MSESGDDDKKARKAALKKEAEEMGISYKELKKRKKKSEVDTLDTAEHQREIKRMRTWSKDFDDEESSKVRRTRSMDVAEEKKAQEEEEEKELSPEEWKKANNITIRGHGALQRETNFSPPFQKFRDAPFDESIQRAFTQAGFEAPTPIQAQAWPFALEKKDMICIAKTGSGKTCGFLLPCFHRHHVEAGARRRPVPVLLVLAPTRELSVQILGEAQKFGRPLRIQSVCTYGGAPKYPQIAALSRGVDCIIATPGRLNDLIEMKKVDLSQIKFLVLDEADRMLDMGFEPQIRSIVDNIPTERQTLLFSATWPKEIQRLAHDFLKDPVQINVGEVDALTANKDITQTIYMISENEKFDKLTSMLKDLRDNVTEGQAHPKVIVFVAKKVSCNDLANHLWDEGFAVDSLHGDRQQWERTKVMQAFKSGVLRMLIATDVAARGLDVKDVGVVINYDMPAGVNAVEDYVHRIGRTGRAGAKGLAYTFFTPGDRKCATQLVDVMTKAGQEIPPELEAMVVRRRPRGAGGRGRGGRGYSGGRVGGRGYMSSGRGYMGRGGRGGGGGYGRGRGGFGRGRGGYGGRGGGRGFGR